MQAAWYDRQGAAADVLQIGELPDPEPAAGEVRVRLTVSAVNPGDTKKRSGWLGNPMAFPRVIPHSDDKNGSPYERNHFVSPGGSVARLQ